MEHKRMTKAEAQAFRARWKRINKLQLAEIRKMRHTLKLRQANMLFRLAKSMNLRHSPDDPEIAEVRERWAKLKRRYEKENLRD